jgi:hypothetical protein
MRLLLDWKVKSVKGKKYHHERVKVKERGRERERERERDREEKENKKGSRESSLEVMSCE